MEAWGKGRGGGKKEARLFIYGVRSTAEEELVMGGLRWSSMLFVSDKLIDSITW